MADYTYETQIARRTVYKLELPTNIAEIGKACAAANQELDRLYEKKHGSAQKRPSYDNDITVSSDGEYLELIIGGRWERDV